MARLSLFAAAVVVLLHRTLTAGSRQLQQTAADPPVPAGLTPLFTWLASGTQNYTTNGTVGTGYYSNGQVVKFYTGTTGNLSLAGDCFFYQLDIGTLEPEISALDANGNVIGSMTAKAAQYYGSPPAHFGDGSQGSISDALYVAINASGTLAPVVAFQQLNSSGGFGASDFTALQDVAGVPINDITVPFTAIFTFYGSSTGSIGATPLMVATAPAVASGPCTQVDKQGAIFFFSTDSSGMPSPNCAPPSNYDCTQQVPIPDGFFNATAPAGSAYQCTIKVTPAAVTSG